MAMSRNVLILIAVIGVTLLVLGVRYLPGETAAPVLQAIGCSDIVQGCAGAGLTVRMDRVPQVMRPFRLTVTAPAADTVDASFRMAGMEMGFNRYRLIKQAGPAAEAAVWQAEVTLPVCVRNRRDWLLLLDVREGAARREIAVAFQTE